MDTSLLITPIAGGVIGYFTNWLAIKMLFRPYTAKHIGKLKLPFTPGLIPKEKDRLANTLGNTVGNYLLTQDVLLERLKKPDVTSSINNILTSGFNFIKCSDLTIDEVLIKAFGKDNADFIDASTENFIEKLQAYLLRPDIKKQMSDIIYSKTVTLLSTRIEDIPLDTFLESIKKQLLKSSRNSLENGIISRVLEKSIWEMMLDLRTDERLLSHIFSFSSVREMKDYISIKVPFLANSIISLTENEEIEAILKNKITGIIQDFAGPFVGMFVNCDDIYVKIIESLTAYFNDPQSMPEIERTVSIAIDKIMSMSVGEAAYILTGELRENSVNRGVNFVLKEFYNEKSIMSVFNKIDGYIEENQKESPICILIGIDRNFDEKLRAFVNVVTNQIFSPPAIACVGEIFRTQTSQLRQKPINYFAQKITESSFTNAKGIFFSLYNKFLSIIAPKIFSAFDIPKIVEERINSFSTEYTEELILSIVNKELKSITAVGGILGFLIGLLPVLISFIQI